MGTGGDGLGGNACWHLDTVPLLRASYHKTNKHKHKTRIVHPQGRDSPEVSRGFGEGPIAELCWPGIASCTTVKHKEMHRCPLGLSDRAPEEETEEGYKGSGVIGGD
jgi:hypothetical protein